MKNTFFIVLLLAIIVFQQIFFFSLKKNNVALRQNTGMQKDEFSIDALHKELKKYKVKFIDVAIAQFMLETGYNTGVCSDILCIGNNLFAMKYALVRPSTADTVFTVSGGGRYAMYSNWRKSVLDYAFYQSHYIKASMQKKDWINFIQKKYSSDKNYSKKIMNIIKNNALKYKQF